MVMITHRLALHLTSAGLITGPLASAAPEADPASLPRIPPTEVPEALATFEIKPGFRIDLAACEPQIVDPIALAWDEGERLFVVEMRGYSERREEALGRIRLLEDRDRDGFYETSHLYAEGLKWPSGVCCYDGGIYVIATPDLLYLKDTDGDRRADHRRVVFTGFAEGRQPPSVQALANGLTWGMDGRIHGATAMNGARLRKPGQSDGLLLRGRDFSFDPATHTLRAEVGGGQYGLTFDPWGNKFVCSNSHHLQWIAYGEGERDLPPALVDISDDGPSAEVFRLSPDEPWRLVRTRWRVQGQVPGPVEGGGRVSGYFTSATGLCSHLGDLFIADAGSNLVHRKALHWSAGVQPIASRPADERRREFLASRDNWFRPVYLASGPDGALYVADFYREVIEHPRSLPPGIKKHLDLNAGNDRGRIYRIVPQAFVRPAPADFSSPMRRLSDPIAWRRLTAARLLHERRDPETPPALRALLQESDLPEARLLALHALANFRALTAEDLGRSLKDANPWVRAAAVRLARETGHAGLIHRNLPALIGDPDPGARFRALLSLPDLSLPDPELSAIIRIVQKDAWCQAALNRATGHRAPALLRAALDSRSLPPPELVSLAGETKPEATIYRRLTGARRLAYLRGAAAGGHDLRKLLSAPESAALLERHAQIARDENLDRERRLTSIALLGALKSFTAGQTLTQLLHTTSDDILASQALAALGKRDEFDPQELLLQPWHLWRPAVQNAIVAASLARPSATLALLDRIESGSIRPSILSRSQISQLQNARHAEIRVRSRALFIAKTKAEREAAVAAARSALSLTGKPSAGQLHYQQRCATCHEPQAGKGKTLGPARQTLARNGKERLLIDLIDPNRDVLPNYFSTTVTKKDGSSLGGVLLRDAETTITILQPLGIETEIARDTIASIGIERKSAMPEGLEAGLSPQDLADLLSYLSGE